MSMLGGVKLESVPGIRYITIPMMGSEESIDGYCFTLWGIPGYETERLGITKEIMEIYGLMLLSVTAPSVGFGDAKGIKALKEEFRNLATCLCDLDAVSAVTIFDVSEGADYPITLDFYGNKRSVIERLIQLKFTTEEEMRSILAEIEEESSQPNQDEAHMKAEGRVAKGVLPAPGLRKG